MAVNIPICQVEKISEPTHLREGKKASYNKIKIVKNHIRQLGGVPKSHNPSVRNESYVERFFFFRKTRKACQ